MGLLATLARHDRIALQLSGGRDSIACLYLMRPWLDRITVYWLNTGAAFPETLAVIEQMRAWVPHFVEIDGDQPGHVARHGIPSDLVPSSHTPIGLLATGKRAGAIQDRYECCANVIMLPLHHRMLADGITLVIRGQKNADMLKSPIRSGEVGAGGIAYLFPIEDWDAPKVDAYLRAEHAPIPRFYEMLSGAPDCMTCTAYWEHGAAAYLKQHHPDAHAVVQHRLEFIKQAVAAHIDAFNVEVAP